MKQRIDIAIYKKYNFDDVFVQLIGPGFNSLRLHKIKFFIIILFTILHKQKGATGIDNSRSIDGETI
jgi:hypothetical protein